MGVDVPVRRPGVAGFTLIEVLLVIVIMAVMAAMIAPSFFHAAGPSLKDQGRRLVQALRLAADEATLTGSPLRWCARKGSYEFRALDGEQAWQALMATPFETFHFPAGMEISAVDPPHLDMVQADGEQEPLIGCVVFPPQGMMDVVEITLSGSAGEVLRIGLYPGPGGIAVEDSGHG